jgi:methyl acetate hydrolase
MLVHLLGRIIEAVSGERLDVYFRKHILGPLGMVDTGFVVSPSQRAKQANAHRRKPDGSLQREPLEKRTTPTAFSGGGSLYSTAPDYLTLIRMLLQRGRFNDVRILRLETVALMGEKQIGHIEAGTLKTTNPALSNDVDWPHDQHGAGAERPRRRQSHLCRTPQHLLLHRSDEAASPLCS